MGASSFQMMAVAPSAKIGYEKLVKDAEYEYGHDSYSGTIATCSLGRVTKSFTKYDCTNRIFAKDHIRALDNGEKYRADVVDLGVKYYIVRKVETTTNEVTAEYKRMYAVCDYDGILKPSKNHVFDKKTDAMDCAKKEALSGKNGIRIRKMPILQEGNDIAVEFKVTETECKEKPKKVDKGCKVIEMHEYIYYGWAAE